MRILKLILAAYLGFVLGSCMARADIVISAAIKNGPGERQSSNSSTTVNGMTDTTNSMLQNCRTDAGILLQVMPTYTGAAYGVGFFTDGAIIATFGVRID